MASPLKVDTFLLSVFVCLRSDTHLSAAKCRSGKRASPKGCREATSASYTIAKTTNYTGILGVATSSGHELSASIGTIALDAATANEPLVKLASDSNITGLGNTVVVENGSTLSNIELVKEDDGIYIASVAVTVNNVEHKFGTYALGAAYADANSIGEMSVRYGDGALDGWDYDSSTKILTKNGNQARIVGGSQYTTLANAKAAANESDTIILFRASSDSIELGSGQTLEILSGVDYTGTVSGSGTLKMYGETQEAPISQDWTGTFAIGWTHSSGNLVLDELGNANSKIRLDSAMVGGRIATSADSGMCFKADASEFTGTLVFNLGAANPSCARGFIKATTFGAGARIEVVSSYAEPGRAIDIDANVTAGSVDFDDAKTSIHMMDATLALNGGDDSVIGCEIDAVNDEEGCTGYSPVIAKSGTGLLTIGSGYKTKIDSTNGKFVALNVAGGSIAVEQGADLTGTEATLASGVKFKVPSGAPSQTLTLMTAMDITNNGVVLVQDESSSIEWNEPNVVDNGDGTKSLVTTPKVYTDDILYVPKNEAGAVGSYTVDGEKLEKFVCRQVQIAAANSSTGTLYVTNGGKLEASEYIAFGMGTSSSATMELVGGGAVSTAVIRVGRQVAGRFQPARRS